MENKDIDFVARHYRRGKFAVDAGWRRLGIGRVSVWRRFRVAAAVAAVLALSATAAIIYNEYHKDETPPKTATVGKKMSPMAEVRVIDFENAPLPEVVRKIESVYGVKVKNLPELPEKYVLSLHYEGTPGDLIAVINEILGTKMTVAEK